MQDAERDRYIAIFEKAAATPLDGYDGVWIELTKEVLGLPMDHIPAVQEALLQGRWRRAKNPKAYLKTVAKREVVKLGLADHPPEDRTFVPLRDENGRWLSLEASIDHFTYDQPVKRHGVWHAKNPDFDPNDYNENGERLSPKERLLKRVPRAVQHMESYIEILAVDGQPVLVRGKRSAADWKAIAAKAGLDADEEFVLQCKLRGRSRERALADLESDAKRKKIQAAWRRFDRRGLAQLRAVLLG